MSGVTRGAWLSTAPHNPKPTPRCPGPARPCGAGRDACPPEPVSAPLSRTQSQRRARCGAEMWACEGVAPGHGEEAPSPRGCNQHLFPGEVVFRDKSRCPWERWFYRLEGKSVFTWMLTTPHYPASAPLLAPMAGLASLPRPYPAPREESGPSWPIPSRQADGWGWGRCRRVKGGDAPDPPTPPLAGGGKSVQEPREFAASHAGTLLRSGSRHGARHSSFWDQRQLTI